MGTALSHPPHLGRSTAVCFIQFSSRGLQWASRVAFPLLFRKLQITSQSASTTPQCPSRGAIQLHHAALPGCRWRDQQAAPHTASSTCTAGALLASAAAQHHLPTASSTRQFSSVTNGQAAQQPAAAAAVQPWWGPVVADQPELFPQLTRPAASWRRQQQQQAAIRALQLFAAGEPTAAARLQQPCKWARPLPCAALRCVAGWPQRHPWALAAHIWGCPVVH